ncbi:hypothetical protein GR702_05375 [Novosphingobium sp. FGD1]|uniref:Uncharacterized protein n=1 Tax=Novosphingobium silvae TaxID=2692619 RepID=A0A7X4GFB5_9SPHN|nr:hypothetical protein [Novosphingobium silvae]MYL97201.1 hypothetical protein [Novosphingobium silvae]
MSDGDRARYEAFLRNNARALASASDDAGEAFGAWLAGTVALDELPLRISDAIMPETVSARAAMASGDFYYAWNHMAHPDRA